MCELTLVVGEEPKAEEVRGADPGALPRLPSKPGSTPASTLARARSLAFYCAPAAAAMSVETMQQTAYTARLTR